MPHSVVMRLRVSNSRRLRAATSVSKVLVLSCIHTASPRFASLRCGGGGALYSRVLLLDNRQRRACLERDPVTLQQFVGWRVVLRYLALFGLVLVALRFLTSAMLPIIAVTVVSEARALQCVQGSFGLRC